MNTKFQPMLAASEIPQDHELRFSLLSSLKLDGIRSPMVNGVAMSRKMLPLPNKHYQEWAGDYAKDLHGLDGEGIVGLPYAEDGDDDVFNRSTRGLMTVTGKPDFTFYVFEDWDSSEPALARNTALAKRVQSLTIPHIQLLQQTLVLDLPSLKTQYDQALKNRYEGLILKHPEHLYKYGRSTVLEGTLLKWKEWADSEARILGIQEGTTNNNPLMKDELGHAKRSTAKAGKVPNGLVGSFLCEDLYSRVKFKCSTGSLTEDQLRELFIKRHELPGQIVVYKFQKSGVIRKPRYPGFKGFKHVLDMGMAENIS